MLTSSNLTYAIDETITEVAFASVYEEPVMWPSLAWLRQSSKARESNGSFGDLSAFAEKITGSDLVEDTPAQQFKQTFTHRAYGKLIRVDRELLDDDEWGTVEEWSRQLGSKAMLLYEGLIADIFNEAFSSTRFLGEDGLCLCNAAHVNGAGTSIGDNADTVAISAANVKSARANMRKFKSYDGSTFVGSNPDELLVPVDLEEDGWALINSTLKPGGNNNDANIFQGRMTLYVWNKITSSTAWFLMDSRLRKNMLRLYMRIVLEILSDYAISQGVRKIGGYTRCTSGFTRWQWCYGSTGAG